MSLRTYLRVSSAAVVVAGAAILAGPAVADAMRPTSGDVTVEFDSCGKASAVFDGDRWVEQSASRPELAGERRPGHLRSTGDDAVVVAEGSGTQRLRLDLTRNGFTTAVGCI